MMFRSDGRLKITGNLDENPSKIDGNRPRVVTGSTTRFLHFPFFFLLSLLSSSSHWSVFTLSLLPIRLSLPELLFFPDWAAVPNPFSVSVLPRPAHTHTAKHLQFKNNNNIIVSKIPKLQTLTTSSL